MQNRDCSLEAQLFVITSKFGAFLTPWSTDHLQLPRYFRHVVVGFFMFFPGKGRQNFRFRCHPPQLAIVAQLSILAVISKRVFVRRRKVVYVSSTVGISSQKDVKKSLISGRNTSGPQCTFFRVFVSLYAVFFEMCRLVLLTDSRPFPQFLDRNVILRILACKIGLTFLVFSRFSSFFDAFLDDSSSWLYHCVLVFVQ